MLVNHSESQHLPTVTHNRGNYHSPDRKKSPTFLTKLQAIRKRNAHLLTQILCEHHI